ncbi:MAG: hypothetical protein H0W96_00710 [Solirubrobacterales bacterium]|nr:hypothetical protein [Solirubrobacterales bacterium]
MDVKTLFITACASAAAAYACSKIWAPGTLASAAFTPVLVALIKEALAKPTAVVARAVPVRGVVRSAGVQDAQQPYESWSAESAGEQLGGDYAPPPPTQVVPIDDPATRVAQTGEVHYHGRSRSRKRGWRVAVITGLLGFLICAVVFTVPELVAGGSAAGGGRDTTIFGGGKHSDRSIPAVTTQTTTTPQEDGARTVTVPPAETVPVPPPEVTTTTPVTPPAETTTVPPTATPVEPLPAQPPG